MLAIIMTIEDEKVRNKVEKVYYRYYSTMLYIAKGILHDEGLAKDAVSEAFIRIIDNVEKIDEVDCNKTRGYVVIIVRNIALNMIKQKNRHQMVSIEEYMEYPDHGEPVLEELTTNEACHAIADAIMRLKDYSDILLLKLVEDYSNREIAEILGLTDENTRSRLKQGEKSTQR